MGRENPPFLMGLLINQSVVSIAVGPSEARPDIKVTIRKTKNSKRTIKE